MAAGPAGHRPTAEELLAADGVAIDDLVRPGLRLLLVGINPGRHSGATGFHFGNPQNLLWRALHHSGLTPRLLQPHETEELLSLGIGITNFVNRTTQGSNDLRAADYRAGAIELHAKVAWLRPRAVAILTVSGYRTGFGLAKAAIGHQPEPLEGSDLWVFPNPSPINTRYPLAFLVERFTELRDALAK
jgi:TDG/mug DNA glycosylase family protein